MFSLEGKRQERDQKDKTKKLNGKLEDDTGQEVMA
jgi:hypothetical protein